MTPRLRLRPAATAEIRSAYEWYEQQRQGLGREFLQEVREMLAAIERSPILYPVIRDDIRRALLHRFPYSLLYVAEPEQTVVLACFHGKRDPRRWYSRH